MSARLRSKVYRAIYRCTVEECKDYKHYGARGIRVYPQWLIEPKLFVEYLLQLPGSNDESLVLDRIDNNGHYEPGNLEFVTCKVSTENRRRPIKYNSPQKCLTDGRAEMFERMHAEGYTYKQIAEMNSISTSVVCRVCRKLKSSRNA